MGKLHLKSVATDRLALCNIWPGNDWVLKELAQQQAEDTICKICSKIAARKDPISPSEL